MIKILKLDHRPERDKRITTHCALVSRAFGADMFYYSGIEDKSISVNIKDISKKWGGKFKVKHTKNPLNFIKKEKNTTVIHLTMYGEQILKKIKLIKTKQKQNLLIIIGGPKVPQEYYELSDYNIAVTNQPHSEVAALTILLNLLNPKYLEEDFFNNQKIKIIPCKKGKKVINLK